jgi:hypothetical protein
MSSMGKKKSGEWRKYKLIDDAYASVLRNMKQDPKNIGIIDAKEELTGAFERLHREALNRGFVRCVAAIFESGNSDGLHRGKIPAPHDLVAEAERAGDVAQRAYGHLLRVSQLEPKSVWDEGTLIKSVMETVFSNATQKAIEIGSSLK